MKAPLSVEYFLQLGHASNLEQIHSLNLSNHGLESLDPALFNKLTSLETLDLSQNKLTAIPETLCVPRLRVLDVSDNMLQSVDFVDNFRRLDELYLEDNKNILMDDYYKAKVMCPSLRSIDGAGEVKHIEAGIRMYISQLQPQIEAVWEAKFSEVYGKGVLAEEINQLHDEFVSVISKAGIIGSNLTMAKFKHFMISHLCKKLLISINKGTFKVGKRTKSSGKEENNTPSKYGTRVSKGVKPLKDYSSGTPMEIGDEETSTPDKKTPTRPSNKRKREASLSESPVAKKKKQTEVPLVRTKPLPRTPGKHLPPTEEYDPSLFLRCHSNDNDPSDSTTKVWKCAFEPSLDTEGETTNTLATCGGNLVCLIDCQTGRVMRRYKDNSSSESFYTLAWTTLIADDVKLREDVNILAVAGEDGVIKLIHPTQLLMFGCLEGHKGYISSLVFHPTRPNILFSGSRDNQIIMWDIGTPDFLTCSMNWKRERVLTLPKTDAVNLVVEPDLDVLVAGCESSCYAWSIPSIDKERKSNTVPPHFEFVHPVMDDEDVPTVDGLALLPNGCIVSKCVGHDTLYVWDLEVQVKGTKRLSGRLQKIAISPVVQLKYTQLDIDYVYPHASGGIVCVGDDKGRLFMYDVSSVVKHKTKHNGEVMVPSDVLEYPEMAIDKKFESRMPDLDESKVECVVNCVDMTTDGKYLVYGTDNNLLCIWKNATIS